MLPVVAVPGRQARSADGVRTEAVAAGIDYLRSLRRAGAEGAVLAHGADGWHERLAAFRGLLLLGGGDVDPARYGATERHPQVKGVREVHDDTELAAVRAALDLGLPVLAICRGHQVLNVALGGTLAQHLDGHTDVLHTVDVTPDTRVAAAMGTLEPTVHSWHHQAIDRLGDGLVVTARAPDGTIEAVELEGTAWVVGVQWHPEDTAADDPANQGLFDAFVAHCH